MIKTCTRCQTPKSLEAFPKQTQKRDGRGSWCKTCTCENSKDWRALPGNMAKQLAANEVYRKANQPKINERSLARRHRDTKRIFDHYGTRCICCGESERAFLTLDHVHGGGHAHRKARGPGGIYRDVIRDGFPSTYQILCMNCNWAKRYGKPCPHEVERSGNSMVGETVNCSTFSTVEATSSSEVV